MNFENKVILITGGNSGIGFATAEKITSLGGRVIITGRDQKKVNMAVETLGDLAIGYCTEISSVKQIELLYHMVEKQVDKLDGVFVNAGSVILESVLEVTEVSFAKTIDINLRGAFFTAQKAVPLMKTGGAILFNASLAAHRSFEKAAIYAASKAALCSLTRSMSLELAAGHIRVNSISPGTVITPIFEKLGMDEQKVEAFIDLYRSRIPLGRAAQPQEIASIAAFLLSSDSSFITGADILADGGQTGVVL